MWSFWRMVGLHPIRLSLTSDFAVQWRTTSKLAASMSHQERQNVLFQLSSQSSKWKVSSESISNAVKTSPELLRFTAQEWNSAFINLEKFGFKGPEVLKMLQKCPTLFTIDPLNMSAIWTALTMFKLSSDKLVRAVVDKPHILCNSPKDAEDKAVWIINFAGAGNNALRVLTVCHNPFALSLAELKEVSEYVKNVMKVRRTHEICRSRVVECPFTKLKCRHNFLVDCGLYTPQSYDIPATIPHSNALLCDIVNTRDEVFAERVAKLTYEEYIVYQEFFEKKRFDEIYDEFDDV